MRAATCLVLTVALLTPAGRAVRETARAAEGSPRPDRRAERILALAGEFRRSGNTYAAITEYKRAVFLHEAEIDLPEVYRSLAFASQELGQYERAVEYARLSLVAESDTLERPRRILDLSSILLAAERPGSAIVELKPLSDAPDREVAREARLLMAVAWIRSHRWSEARRALRSYETLGVRDADLGPAAAARIDSILGVLAAAPRRRPETAELLSTIVPGAGQMYAGHPLESLHALLLSAVTGYWTYTTAVDGTLLECALGPFSWFFRYYDGNRYWAGERVRRDNEAADRAASARLMEILSP